jgi:hypothetical protein
MLVRIRIEEYAARLAEGAAVVVRPGRLLRWPGNLRPPVLGELADAEVFPASLGPDLEAALSGLTWLERADAAARLGLPTLSLLWSRSHARNILSIARLAPEIRSRISALGLDPGFNELARVAHAGATSAQIERWNLGRRLRARA